MMRKRVKKNRLARHAADCGSFLPFVSCNELSGLILDQNPLLMDPSGIDGRTTSVLGFKIDQPGRCLGPRYPAFKVFSRFVKEREIYDGPGFKELRDFRVSNRPH